MSIVLRDVGPSLVGGWVLPHEGTILQKHIRHAGEVKYPVNIVPIYYKNYIIVIINVRRSRDCIFYLIMCVCMSATHFI